jgi:hypothetical protein
MGWLRHQQAVEVDLGLRPPLRVEAELCVNQQHLGLWLGAHELCRCELRQQRLASGLRPNAQHIAPEHKASTDARVQQRHSC